MSSPFDADDFRRALHRAADLAADYVEEVGDLPVLPGVEPGDLMRALPEAAPEEGESFDALLDDFRRLVVPGVTHWNHPGFLAYFSSNASEPGILGEMLAGALGVNAMLWHTSPAATELELKVCDWMRRALGLPEGFDGHINDTASISTFLALAVARDRDPASGEKLDVRHRGLQGAPPMTVYCSDQTHSSIDKAVIALGLGLDQLRHVESDDAFRMDPAALERAVEADLEAGRKPIAVVATVGTTSTTSNDPVGAIADVCERHDLLLHVDAAWAGTAALCPELRRPFEGWERADSIVVNPHKWMATPLDCSLLFVRDPDALRAAFSLVPEYLRTGDAGDGGSPEHKAAKVDLMDFGVQLGRRFRSLKLWYVLRAFGLERLRNNVRQHLRWGEWVEEQVEADPHFELAAPRPWSVVCLRAVLDGADPEREDELNARVLEEVNRGGEIFLSHTKLRGRYVIRVAVSNLRTEERHVRAAWEQIRSAAERLREEG